MLKDLEFQLLEKYDSVKEFDVVDFFRDLVTFFYIPSQQLNRDKL